MPNHLKIWQKDDHVLANLNFPDLPAEQLVSLTDPTLTNGKRLIPTGNYKYRCTDCGAYYDHRRVHQCVDKNSSEDDSNVIEVVS